MYIKKSAVFFFFFLKPGTALINENMHFIRRFEFHLSYNSHQEINSTGFFFFFKSIKGTRGLSLSFPSVNMGNNGTSVIGRFP